MATGGKLLNLEKWKLGVNDPSNDEIRGDGNAKGINDQGKTRGKGTGSLFGGPMPEKNKNVASDCKGKKKAHWWGNQFLRGGGVSP